MNNTSNGVNHQADRALQALKKDYLVIGKTRVTGWHAWLVIGLAAGIVAGITLVASRGGDFQIGKAATPDLTSGLVGWWTFDNADISGTTAIDKSGQGNNGVINGATPGVSGQVGQALQFDGVDDAVSVPFINLANKSFTISAWIKGVSFKTNGNDNVIVWQKDADALNKRLHVTVRNQKPYFGFFNNDLPGNTTLQPSAWYLLTFVYDASLKKRTIYLNGNPDGSDSPASSYQGTVGNTMIGGTNISLDQQTFNGLIDDVRIYTRALAAADVSCLFNSILCVSVTDTTPPVRSNPAPSGTLPASTLFTTLSLSTDENATCKYSSTSGTSYAAMINTFSVTGGITHSTVVSGLTSGASYTYYVRCQDIAGNANPNDYPISFSVATATTPPSPSGPFLDIRDFGAKTDGSDATLAIQNALDAARTADGGIVYVPPGMYVISAPLKIYSGTLFLGTAGHRGGVENARQSTIRNVAITNTIDMQVNHRAIEIRGINFTGTLPDNTRITQGAHIAINEFTSTIRDCSFFGKANAIRVESANPAVAPWDVLIEGNYFVDQEEDAIYWAELFTTLYIRNNAFKNTICSTCRGAYLQGHDAVGASSAMLEFTGNFFNGWSGSADGSAVWIDGVDGVNFSNNYFEAVNGTAAMSIIRMRDVQSVTFMNNWFFQRFTPILNNGLDLVSFKHVFIAANHWEGIAGKSAIRFGYNTSGNDITALGIPTGMLDMGPEARGYYVTSVDKRLGYGGNPNDGVVTVLSDMKISTLGNIGIGTTNPKAKLEVGNGGDVYVNTIGNGIILRSPNGNCFRVAVDNNGDYSKTSVSCPTGGTTLSLQQQLSPTPPLTATPQGSIRIKRVDQNLALFSSQAWVDSQSQTSSNPADFVSLTAGSHTAYVNDAAGYTETAGTCSYALGGTECSVTLFTLTPSCNGSSCSISASVSNGQTTKIAVMYTPIVAAPTSSSSSCLPAISGLIGCWKLDDGIGLTAADSSGNANTLILTNPLWTTGQLNGAVSFNGSNSKGTISTVKTLAPGNTPHSITAWIKVNQIPSIRAWILLLGNQGSGSHHWLINSAGATQFGVWGGAQFSPALPLGQWRHVAMTFDGAILKGYVNGVSIGSVPASFNLQGIPMTLAERPALVPGENYFNGLLDDVRIYNRALSASDINQVYIQR